VLPSLTARPEHVERALKARYQDATNILKPQGRELELLIVILPDNNGSLYGMISSKEHLKITKRILLLIITFHPR
jgi:hypothetical protein